MKFLRHEATICPYCNAKLDASTDPSDPAAKPNKGDLTVCVVCLNILIFADDSGKLRKLTEEENKTLPSTPEYHKVQKIQRIFSLRRNMKSTDLKQYIGGQIEIINEYENYHYRCQIKSIEIVNDVLCIDFDYCCKFHPSQGYKPDKNVPYKVSTFLIRSNDIDDNQFAISIAVTHELCILYPPNYKRYVAEDGSMIQRG